MLPYIQIPKCVQNHGKKSYKGTPQNPLYYDDWTIMLHDSILMPEKIITATVKALCYKNISNTCTRQNTHTHTHTHTYAFSHSLSLSTLYNIVIDRKLWTGQWSVTSGVMPCSWPVRWTTAHMPVLWRALPTRPCEWTTLCRPCISWCQAASLPLSLWVCAVGYRPCLCISDQALCVQVQSRMDEGNLYGFAFWFCLCFAFFCSILLSSQLWFLSMGYLDGFQ